MVFSHDVSHQKNQRSKNGPLPYCEAFLGQPYLTGSLSFTKALHRKVSAVSVFGMGGLSQSCSNRAPDFFSLEICKLHRHRPQIEKVGTDGSQRGNQRLPWQGTAGSQTLKLTVPNLGTKLSLQGIAGSQKLEFMFSKLSNYHCKELRIPKV